MPYLVDGNNVMAQTVGWHRDRAAARKRLIRDLARFHALSVEEFSAQYLRRVSGRLALIEKANGDCVFYRGGCTVYSARPTQCRTFPFWPENLRSRAAWEQTADECPGIGQGTLYSADAIRLIRRGKEEACAPSG